MNTPKSPYDDLIYAKRPVSERHGRMKRSDRAKQFAPFSALKGLEKAIQEQENLRTQPVLLSETRNAELDYLLHQVQPGQSIQITFYNGQRYQTVKGQVRKIDRSGKFLLVDECRVPIASIYEIQGSNLISFTE